MRPIENSAKLQA